MADYWPAANGNWSTLSNWLTAIGVTAGALPGPLDDVYADNKTITVDIDFNVASVRTTARPSGTAGGSFNITTTRSLTAANVLAGSSSCLNFSAATPNVLTFTGSPTGSSTKGTYALLNSSSGRINAFGNIYGQAGIGLGNTSSGTVNLVGNIFRVSIGVVNDGDVAGGLYVAGTSVTSVTGNIFGTAPGGASHQFVVRLDNAAVLNLSGSIVMTAGLGLGNIGQSGSVVNMRGDVNCSSGAGGVRYGGINTVTNIIGNIFQNTTGTAQPAPAVEPSLHPINPPSSVTVNITGNLFGGNQTSTNQGGAVSTSGLGAGSTSVVNVFGNAYGGSGSGSNHGVFVEGGTVIVRGNTYGGTGGTDQYTCGISNGGIYNISGRVIVFGSCIGRNTVGLRNTNSFTVTATRAVGGPGGPLNTTGGTAAGVSNTQNGQVYVEEVEFGAQGASPISGPVFMLPRSTNVTVMNQGLFSFTPVTLFRSTNFPGLVPPASAVRLDTVYGNGDFTGTMIVPSPDSVQLGVQVDNTVGRAALSPISVWNFSRSASLSAGSIGERVRNALTTQAAGSIIASFNLSGAS